jgi:tripartite-type tricarboxylate transporter receptor subunit TctC
MKRFSVLLLILIFVVIAFVGCGNNGGGSKDDANGDNESANEKVVYPTGPIEMIITFKAGGAADISGRGYASAAEDHLGVPIGVQNITGAGGSTGFDHIRRADPDGMQICWLSASILTQTNLGHLNYDYSEWEYVCRGVIDATSIAVSKDSPWKNLEELVEYAKENPGKVTIGHAGTGSFTHLTAVAFARAADIDVRLIPSGKDRVPDLLAGEVDAISVHPPEILDLYKAGDINMLAISAEDRVESYPEVPLFGEVGYEVDILQFRGIMVPKGTSRDVTKVLEEAFRKASQEEEVLELANNRGFQVAFQGYDEFNKFVTEQNKMIADLVKYLEESEGNN